MVCKVLQLCRPLTLRVACAGQSPHSVMSSGVDSYWNDTVLKRVEIAFHLSA